jgi:hypothetical protein
MTKKWNDNLGAFLPKTSNFFHPCLAYPPAIPVGPTFSSLRGAPASPCDPVCFSFTPCPRAQNKNGSTPASSLPRLGNSGGGVTLATTTHLSLRPLNLSVTGESRGSPCGSLKWRWRGFMSSGCVHWIWCRGRCTVALHQVLAP